MAGYDPWAATNAGLVNLGSNISNINNRRLAESENQRRNSLADLQIQSAQAGMNDSAAKDEALLKMTGTTNLSDAYVKQAVAAKASSDSAAILAEAMSIDKLAGPEAALDFYNGKTGKKLEYSGKKGEWATTVDKDTGAIYAFNSRLFDPKNPTAAFQVIKEGTPKVETPKLEQVTPGNYVKQPDGTFKQIGTPTRLMVPTGGSGSGSGTGGAIGKLDAETVKSAIKTLPTLKAEANSANNSIARIDKMQELIKSGVGGKKGQLASILSPYAEAAGFNSRFMTDAKLYETLSKTLGGSMRMEIVGPGAVSNYEAGLLQKVSAGGNAGSAAAAELLTYYRDLADSKIQNYHDTIDGISEYSPAATKVYKKIGGRNTPPPAGNRPPPKF